MLDFALEDTQQCLRVLALRVTRACLRGHRHTRRQDRRRHPLSHPHPDAGAQTRVRAGKRKHTEQHTNAYTDQPRTRTWKHTPRSPGMGEGLGCGRQPRRSAPTHAHPDRPTARQGDGQSAACCTAARSSPPPRCPRAHRQQVPRTDRLAADARAWRKLGGSGALLTASRAQWRVCCARGGTTLARIESRRITTQFCFHGHGVIDSCTGRLDSKSH